MWDKSKGSLKSCLKSDSRHWLLVLNRKQEEGLRFIAEICKIHVLVLCNIAGNNLRMILANFVEFFFKKNIQCNLEKNSGLYLLSEIVKFRDQNDKI